MNRLEEIARELARSPELRQRFAAQPRAVAGELGLDPETYAVPETIDLATLESRLEKLVPVVGRAEAAPAIITAPVAESPMARQHGLVSPRHCAERRAEIGTQPRMLALPELAPRAPLSVAPAPTRNVLTEYFPGAWFASNGTGASRVAAQKLETTRSLVRELVIGSDDRVQVADPRAIPYRWICSLVITAGNGSVWQGTGWMVAPRVLVTAGHCVYMRNHGGWVSRVTVLPGRNGAAAPTIWTSTQPWSVAGWVNDEEPEFDYGALILDVAPGTEQIGYFGYGAASDDALLGTLANVTGYPADKDPGTLWGCARQLRVVRRGTLLYDIDTYGGMSGAPVIRWDGQDYLVVGIHNYGDFSGNQATRITPEVFYNIEYWKSMAG